MTDRILVLHGALGSAHQFTEIQDRIAETGTAVSVMEFVGHGDHPDVDGPWTMDLFVDQLASYLDEHRWNSANIFGYSMGGYVAMTLAVRRPELVGRILTLGTKLHWTTEGALAETRMLDAEKIASKVPHFAQDLAARHGADHWKTVLQKTAEMMLDLGTSPRLTPDTMDRVACPVRFMLGDRDEMVTLEETRTFQQSTPGSELSVLPGTRHPIEKVRPELVEWHIRDFLLV